MAHHASRVLAALMVGAMATGMSGCMSAVSDESATAPPPTSLVALGTMSGGGVSGDEPGPGRCAGVLIGPRRVLSPAHCLRNRKTRSMEVRILDQDGCRVSVRRRARSVASTGVAAVVRLRGRVPDSAADPITVGHAPTEGDDLVAWGWGPGTPGDGCVPRPVRLEVISDEECSDLVGDDGVGLYFCAEPKGVKDTCAGDNGGPVLDEKGRLVGMTIGAKGCTDDGPGKYWTTANLVHQSG